MTVRNLLASMALAGLICMLISTPAVTKQILTIDGQVRSMDPAKTVPGQLSYQGYLADVTDSAAVTATLEMTFRLFDSETKGAELWSETHAMVEVADGLFQVLLGSMTTFPASLFDGSPLWLQTEVGTEVLAPRKALVSVAYSQMSQDADHAADADDADLLEGHSLTDLDDRWVNLEGLDHLDAADGDPANAVSVDDAGKVGIGTTDPLTELDVAGSVNATTYYGDGSNLTGISGTTDNDWIISAPDIYSALAGKVGIGITHPTTKLEVDGAVKATTYYGDGSNLTGISGTADDDWTISGDTIYHETGNVGIGTTTPSAMLDVDGVINTDSLYEIQGLPVLSASNTIGNTLVGVNAGLNTTAGTNTFLGNSAGHTNTAGYSNTFVGYQAGHGNSSGNFNTFIGYTAGKSNTGGDKNTFLGEYAGYGNLTGNWNTYIGGDAGYNNNTGNSNTFQGYRAGYNNTGSHNTLIGRQAGIGNITGDANVFLGYRAGTTEEGSHKLYIANGPDTNDVLIYGDFFTGNVGLGTLNPGQRLHIAGHQFIQGPDGFDSADEEATLYLGDTAKYLRATYGGALTLYSNDPLLLRTFADANQLYLSTLGRVGIGTGTPAYKLDVNGDINVSGSYNIKKGGTNYTHPDYVFEPDYELMPLDKLKEHVFAEKSLPDVISAEDVKNNNGFKMDELLVQMLEKIEEQTLYIFQLEERIAALEVKR